MPAPIATTATAAVTHDEVHNGIRFLVMYRGGADEDAPLIVGMHGRGGSPERFSRALEGYAGRAEIALAQAPTRFGSGWAWWHSADESEFIAAFDAAEKQLWQAITEIAHGRRVFVTGFSQGGMLSYVLAARHPREIAYAFPMGGGAPPQLLPHDRAPAPLYALHGKTDEMVEIGFARSTVAAFKAQGGTAELREFEGLGHDMSPELRQDLQAHIRAAIDADDTRAATPGSALREGRAARGAGVREADAAPESLR